MILSRYIEEGCGEINTHDPPAASAELSSDDAIAAADIEQVIS